MPHAIFRHKIPKSGVLLKTSQYASTAVTVGMWPATAFDIATLSLHLTTRLINAAQGGNTASVTWTTDLLLTKESKPNLLDVTVDGVAAQALTDTNAHISVISLTLRWHLRKVLTPPMQTFVRVANESTPSIAGMRTA